MAAQRYGVFSESDARKVADVVRSVLTRGAGGRGRRHQPVDDVGWRGVVVYRGVVYDDLHTATMPRIKIDHAAGTVEETATERPDPQPGDETWYEKSEHGDVIVAPYFGADGTYPDGNITGAASIPGGIICMWSGTTAPDGWYLCDGYNGTPDLRGRFVVGYSGSGDYTQPGDLSEGGTTAGGTGGEATHGDGTNDHLPHKVNHSHPTCVTTTTADVFVYCLADLPTGHCVSVLNSVGVELNCICDDLIGSTPTWWCRETDDPPDTSQIEDGADHEADAGENVAWHSSTDNRPPYYVLAYIMKAL